jgi:hypothetical protein
MVKNGNKTEVVKVGMKEVTREGFEYELTVNLEILTDTHYVKASKDRTGLFMGQPEFIPTEQTGKMIRDWCETGSEPEKPEPKQKITLTPDHKHWVLIQKKLAEGTTTLNQLDEFYTISDEHKEQLLELAAS